MKFEWEKHREKIIGMGDSSAKKSYYPQLQKKIEELQRSRDSYQSILNNANDCILLHDEEGTILMMNDRTHQSMSIPKNEKQTITIEDISSSKNDLTLLKTYWAQVIQGKPLVFEWITKKYKSPEEFTVEVTLNRTIWYEKQCIVAVIRDITERKNHETELIESRKKAEESDKLKSAFLANMSHEIRTPMNSIFGFTELLSDPGISEETKQKYIQIILQNGDRLLTIINDLIDISIIEAGQIKLKHEITNINLILENQVAFFAPDAKKRGLELNLQTDSSTLYIETDKTRFSQILTNLINNALKFTELGSITVGYKLPTKKMVTFFVKDTGKGIPVELHKKIFNRFQKADITKDKIIEGTGLGLSISKAFVEMLGGQIWVESIPDEGSCFYFTHPVKPCKNPIRN